MTRGMHQRPRRHLSIFGLIVVVMCASFVLLCVAGIVKTAGAW